MWKVNANIVTKISNIINLIIDHIRIPNVIANVNTKDSRKPAGNTSTKSLNDFFLLPKYWWKAVSHLLKYPLNWPFLFFKCMPQSLIRF